MTHYRLSVIIAEENAAENLPDILRATAPELHRDVEFIISSSSAVAGVPAAATDENVRWLAAEGRIPLLWRDGILAASADTVALTTAHCIPAPDWIDGLLRIHLEGDLVAVGGAIANPEDAGPLGWAIYLLRYFPYRPHGERRQVQEIAADNSLYLRAAILNHRDLLQPGFWEPTFHRCFHREGRSLHFDPQLVVWHHNRYTTRQFCRQRMDHGFAFGTDRAARMSHGKLLVMTLLSPAIPPVFLSKVLARIRGDRACVPAAIRSLPLLVIFACAWGLGEGKAYLLSCAGRIQGTAGSERAGNRDDG